MLTHVQEICCWIEFSADMTFQMHGKKFEEIAVKSIHLEFYNLNNANKILTGLDGETIWCVRKFIGCSECTHFDTVCCARFQWTVTVAAQAILAIFNANCKIFDGTVLEWIVWFNGLVWRPNAIRLHITPAGHFETRCVLRVIFSNNDCVHIHLKIGIFSIGIKIIQLLYFFLIYVYIELKQCYLSVCIGEVILSESNLNRCRATIDFSWEDL